MTVGPVVAFVPDLMDRSRISAAIDGVRFVARPDDLVAAEAATFIVDLTRPGALDVVGRLHGRVIGFGNHTARDVLEAAARVGCLAMTRSSFFADVSAAVA